MVAYDEPDTHLDYGHQRDLVDLIRKQCEVPGVSVVIATHSLNLIDKVSIEDVVHLELEHERTVVKRLFGDDHGAVDRHLMDIAASMGLRNSALLHERCFVGVEGVTEQQAIPILFRTATGLTLQAAGIALVPAGGNAGARAFCKYLTNQGREVRFIVDRDSAAHKVFTPAKLRAEGIANDQMFLVGAPKEIEDLFTDAQWAAVAEAAGPRNDGSPWTANHFAKLRKSGKFSDRLHELLTSNSASAQQGSAPPGAGRNLDSEGRRPKGSAGCVRRPHPGNQLALDPSGSAALPVSDCAARQRASSPGGKWTWHRGPP